MHGALALGSAADALARSWGHSLVGTEHVIQCIVEQERSLGRRLLGAAGCSPTNVRASVEALAPPGNQTSIVHQARAPQIASAAATAVRVAAQTAESHVNTAHVLIAIAEGESRGAEALTRLQQDAGSLRAVLQEVRKNELRVRHAKRGLPRNHTLNPWPDPTIVRFAADKPEIDRLVSFLEDAGRGSQGSTSTSDVVRFTVAEQPELWDSFLTVFGYRASSFLRDACPAEPGGAWLVPKVGSGHTWLEVTREPAPGRVEISLPAAEAVWRYCALLGAHGCGAWYPDLLACMVLATPGTWANQAMTSGGPPGLDVATACFARAGFQFDSLTDALRIPINLFEPIEPGEPPGQTAEIDQWVIRHGLREAVVGQLRSHERKLPGHEPNREDVEGWIGQALNSYKRIAATSRELSPFENELVCGAIFASASIAGSLEDAVQALIESTRSVLEEPRPMVADRLLESGTVLARAAGDEDLARAMQRDRWTARTTFWAAADWPNLDPPLKAAWSADEQEAALTCLFKSTSLTAIYDAIRARPWLLSFELDEVVDQLAAADRANAPVVYLGGWSSTAAIRQFRNLARNHGTSFARTWMSLLSDREMGEQYRASERAETKVRAALVAWDAAGIRDEPGYELADRELALASALGPPARRMLHASIHGGVSTRRALTSGDATHRDAARRRLQDAELLLRIGDDPTAAIAGYFVELEGSAFEQTGLGDNLHSAVAAITNALMLVPEPEAIVRLLGDLALICTWPGSFGSAAAREQAEAGLVLAQALGVPPGERLESVVAELARVDRDAASPIERARQALDRAVELSRADGKQPSRDPLVALEIARLAIVSEDPAEIRRGLDAISRLTDEHQARATAQILVQLGRHAKIEMSERRRAQEAADAAWDALTPARPLRDVLRVAQLRVDVAKMCEDDDYLTSVGTAAIRAAMERYEDAEDDEERIALSRQLNGFLLPLANDYHERSRTWMSVVAIEAGRGLLLDTWAAQDRFTSDTEARGEPALPSGLAEGVATASDPNASALAAELRIEAAAARQTLIYLTIEADQAAAWVVRDGRQAHRVELNASRAEILQRAVDLIWATSNGVPISEFALLIEKVGAWLWPTVVGPLIDAGLPFEQRVCVIPTDLFANLPIQIAWTHDNEQPAGRRYLADVCEFTQSPSAGLLARCQGACPPLDLDHVVAVAPETSAGLAELTFAPREVLEVAASFRSSEILDGPAANVRQFEQALAKPHSVFHFSGHGVGQPGKSLQSLILNGPTSYPMSALRFRRAQGRRLAVASACVSGISDPSLAFEAVSVSSELLAAGYRGAIGTSWNVSDLATTILFARFYGILAASGRPVEDIAGCLHAAQRWLRTSTTAEITEAYPWTRFPMRGMTSADEVPFADPVYWAGPVFHGA
jgi:CHAT domain-containing protein